ncbi:hypothetical protein SAMN04490244_104270 [Tranquillimonas rosea]|uniref:Uncharacterized protein n=2 Tax=Tranquillimonas rosea TaxID=641238 RepID=A0A1H9TMH3_9RHOB|nr:hypothetical protein [Tranquillimonas rosea]SER98356.1 hypothetical protein SAMN04490244_104270 [Tranquillimonas rosea]
MYDRPTNSPLIQSALKRAFRADTSKDTGSWDDRFDELLGKLDAAYSAPRAERKEA